MKSVHDERFSVLVVCTGAPPLSPFTLCNFAEASGGSIDDLPVWQESLNVDVLIVHADAFCFIVEAIFYFTVVISRIIPAPSHMTIHGWRKRDRRW